MIFREISWEFFWVFPFWLMVSMCVDVSTIIYYICFEIFQVTCRLEGLSQWKGLTTEASIFQHWDTEVEFLSPTSKKEQENGEKANASQHAQCFLHVHPTCRRGSPVVTSHHTTSRIVQVGYIYDYISHVIIPRYTRKIPKIHRQTKLAELQSIIY